MNRTEIESRIGYTFRDGALLERALTHGSAESDPEKNYQSLEFLGDSILSFVVAKKLVELYPAANEGLLTKMRACIVSEQPLAETVTALGIAENLRVGEGEKKNRLHEHDSIKSDIYESVVAAIYLDGGLKNAEKFVLKTLSEHIRNAKADTKKTDAKSKLNEYAMKHGKKAEYVELAREGEPHMPVFRYAASVGGVMCGEGSGGSKREAQQAAAAAALDKLRANGRK